mmetsp:Transcript_11692/g.43568  ORF Transcript_11692/g.43568 Transcript_11692/m.43568 type:complete len:263 (-) Transcript_11692:567-1355(-)
MNMAMLVRMPGSGSFCKRRSCAGSRSFRFRSVSRPKKCTNVFNVASRSLALPESANPWRIGSKKTRFTASSSAKGRKVPTRLRRQRRKLLSCCATMLDKIGSSLALNSPFASAASIVLLLSSKMLNANGSKALMAPRITSCEPMSRMACSETLVSRISTQHGNTLSCLTAVGRRFRCLPMVSRNLIRSGMALLARLSRLRRMLTIGRFSALAARPRSAADGAGRSAGPFAVKAFRLVPHTFMSCACTRGSWSRISSRIRPRP